MATLSFDRVNKCIIVDPPDLEVTIQEVYNATRLFEGELANMDIDPEDSGGPQGGAISAAGKEALGGGFFVGITLELINNWRVIFSDPGATDGLVGAIVRGGNLVATNSFNNNPIKPQSNVQVTIAQATSAAIINLPAIEADTSLILKVLINRLELAEGTTGNWVLYDDNDTTVLLTWDVTDKDGTGIVLATGIPARRTRGVAP